MSAICFEYKCGCIVHQLAGKIRKCEGCTNRSLSGRMQPKPDNAEARHNKAMQDEPFKTYDVASILP
jgi:hypothetical protein